MRTLFLALILTTAGCSMESQGTSESALGGHGTDAHAPPDRDGGSDPCKYDGGQCTERHDGGAYEADAGWEPPKDGGGFTGDASWEPPKDGGGSSVDGGHVDPPVDAGGHRR